MYLIKQLFVLLLWCKWNKTLCDGVTHHATVTFYSSLLHPRCYKTDLPLISSCPRHREARYDHGRWRWDPDTDRSANGRKMTDFNNKQLTMSDVVAHGIVLGVDSVIYLFPLVLFLIQTSFSLYQVLRKLLSKNQQKVKNRDLNLMNVSQSVSERHVNDTFKRRYNGASTYEILNTPSPRIYSL